jgi:enoyl-CoA hydratase/carnithine racemase
LSELENYANRYETIKMQREDGVLEVTIHSGGGPAVWGITETGLHNELGLAFAEIGRDLENRVVILTGSGDAFCAQFDVSGPPVDVRSPLLWDRIVREGQALITNLLDIPVPVIGAVNGPALIHAELPLLSDIVLAAEEAEFADLAHVLGGTVPGDGVHVFWPMVLGPNRGRYFLLTGERLSAKQAYDLGVVGEVLPREALMPRAWQLARGLATKPELMLRYTRKVLTQHLKRRMAEDLVFGLVMEGMAVVGGS